MRTLLVLAVLSSLLVAQAGCSKLMKKGGDDEADAAAEAEAAPVATTEPEEDAAPPPPAEPQAKNAAEVARFAAESKIEDDGAKIAVTTTARQSPRAGAVVATLRPGNDVTKVAEYQDCFLATFADPKDSSATLMGWIAKEAFSAPTIIRDAGARDAAPPSKDAGAPPPKADAGSALVCGAGTVAVVLSTGQVCKKKCAKDSDCKAGPCSLGSSAAGKVVRICAAD